MSMVLNKQTGQSPFAAMPPGSPSDYTTAATSNGVVQPAMPVPTGQSQVPPVPPSMPMEPMASPPPAAPLLQPTPPSANPLNPMAAPAVVPTQPLAASGAIQQPAVTDEDADQIPVDDIVWISRAKRVLTETKGNPHRQVQLIQHLRSQYLKQRYGRTVHTDDEV